MTGVLDLGFHLGGQLGPVFPVEALRRQERKLGWVASDVLDENMIDSLRVVEKADCC